MVVAVRRSLMVSYTRARAEALGVECKVGIATRAVRVVILSAGLVFAKGASLGDFELLEASVYVLAALSVFTDAPAHRARASRAHRGSRCAARSVMLRTVWGNSPVTPSRRGSQPSIPSKLTGRARPLPGGPDS